MILLLQRKEYSVLLLLVIFAFINTKGVKAQPKAPEGMKWEAIPQLCDEFDEWDNSKWTKSLWNYGVPVKMMAKNSGVSDGKLWIKASLDKKEAKKEDGRWFETSRVMSKTRVKFPMYTECRMKTSHLSAFATYWLNNGNSANRDEIDICEHNSNPSFTDQVNRPYTMYSQYFIVEDDNTERHHGNFDNRKLSDDNPAKGRKWNEEYQVLGCWWIDEHHVQFYINGEKAGKVESKQNFTREQNIIWDLWTSKDKWTGGIADKKSLSDDSINTMYVDWIHTYKLVKSN